MSSFDEVSQGWLVRFVEHRIGDPRIVRLIQKWLKADVLEGGIVTVSDKGTGQPETFNFLGSPSSVGARERQIPHQKEIPARSACGRGFGTSRRSCGGAGITRSPSREMAGAGRQDAGGERRAGRALRQVSSADTRPRTPARSDRTPRGRPKWCRRPRHCRPSRIDGAAVVAELQDAGIFITLPQPLQILESERVRRCCDPERLRQVAVERAERLNPVERAGSTVTSAARNQR